MTYLEKPPLSEVDISLSAQDFAEAERNYASEQRKKAKFVEHKDPVAAAELQLEADLCELWAEHILDENAESHRELEAAKEEYALAMRGAQAPRGGIQVLIERSNTDKLERQRRVETTHTGLAACLGF